MQEVAKILETYGLTPEQSQPIVVSLSKNPKAWVDFMMRFELGLDEPDPKRALASALTIAEAYIAGSFTPLSAHIFAPSAVSALTISIVVTLIALGIFGYVTGAPPLRSAIQTVVIGGLAAAAFAIARAFS